MSRPGPERQVCDERAAAAGIADAAGGLDGGSAKVDGEEEAEETTEERPTLRFNEKL